MLNSMALGCTVSNPAAIKDIFQHPLKFIIDSNRIKIMEIQSKLLGNQQVNPETIINFPYGIPGFEDQTRFKLFHQEGSEIVFWLQSLDNPELTFSVANPLHFNINYSFTLTDEEEQLLDVKSVDDLVILILLHKDNEKDNSGKPMIKGSIKSPVLINSEKRIGYQKVLPVIEQSITLIEKTSEIAVSEV